MAAALDAAAERVPATTERRLVTVLFADLAGYTTLSEGRDYEEVRAFQDRYFAAARTVIGRYGGVVEKFIGDAVMALWGAPVAREDDAERAVRAGLDLVDAVATLADSAVEPGLGLRVGVMTGEAMVDLAAEGQGLVTGDLVNTASRVQSVAAPGSVLVGDATRRASAAAIAYTDAGSHELKGKAESVALWQARQVVGQRGGGGRGPAADTPFVGRAGELRLVRELFHACADQGRARLVSILGPAGIGKSRLAWEFEKHVDGLIADVWWHRGRCLSYGDGVAYRALADMVRSRARILEDEPPDEAAAKLSVMLAEQVADPAERAWIEPRLAHLLGLADRTAPDREDLFSAWRRFFERLAEQSPVVLVFEDIHWADESLVAFIEYLLDWSRQLPIFVMTLARPEVADRHPGFPGAARSSTTLALDPLDDDAMRELLTALLPGLPADLAERLRRAAEGIPLYAVETVRMLRDRGLVATMDGATRVVGAVDDIAVPETLHALIAARLDALTAEERGLLQDAAVLGKTFTARGLASVSGLDEPAVERIVASLVRKELLAIQSDPFSPDRGQFGFLQALVQRVAYDTIARRDRRARHLAAARYLAGEPTIDADEIAEVIASHYLDAHLADPAAGDADDVRAEARRWFARAAERASSLAATVEAQRAFERAAGLTADDGEQGALLARAGDLAIAGGRLEDASRLLLSAIELLDASDRHAEVAAAQARHAEVLFVTGRIEEAIDRLTVALGAHQGQGDDRAVAWVSCELARMLFFASRATEAHPHVERAIDIAERDRLYEVLVQAFNNKALLLDERPEERLALLHHARALAAEHDFAAGEMRSCMNLSYALSISARGDESEMVIRRGLELARLRGNRVWERALASNLISECLGQGRWDEAVATYRALPDEGVVEGEPVQAYARLMIARIALRRGDGGEVIADLEAMAAWTEVGNYQAWGVRVVARGLLALAGRRPGDALALALEALDDAERTDDREVVDALAELGLEAALDVGTSAGFSDLLERVEPRLGRATPGPADLRRACPGGPGRPEPGCTGLRRRGGRGPRRRRPVLDGPRTGRAGPLARRDAGGGRRGRASGRGRGAGGAPGRPATSRPHRGAGDGSDRPVFRWWLTLTNRARQSLGGVSRMT